MTSPASQQLRRIWLQFHKWIGILLAVLLIPLSLSGALLVWNDELDYVINPQRYAVSAENAALPVSVYVAAARTRLKDDDRIAKIQFAGAGSPVIITAARVPAEGQPKRPPMRTLVWLDPASAHVLDTARENSGVMRVIHKIHGNLLIPEIGRKIVGVLGIAMLISCLTGLWLWWPTVGRWTRGLRWRRARTFDANLHHLVGFWVLLPLTMLCVTGVWISFPEIFNRLAGEWGGGAGLRAARSAVVLPANRMNADEALGAVQKLVPGKWPWMIEWPTDLPAPWRVTIDLPGTSKGLYRVDDSTGVVRIDTSRPPQLDFPVAAAMRRWHDGVDMGLAWRLFIFLGGIAPAVLGITGILIWLRTRRWRKKTMVRQGALDTSS